MKKKPKEKLFIVRKYIKALSAAEAIRKERSAPVDDVWIDDDWKRGQSSQLAEAMGFSLPPKHEDS
jgi:hypothetical protein